ncbi:MULTISPECIES: GapA-binding peptide SR1P [Geomicrobium]|nr:MULTISPECIES: GapA-binding peptide SR1P [Geomicrobium]
MSIIICGTCNCTIEHYQGEKISTLYSSCNECKSKKKKK